jgi:hypothetical protein
MAFFPFPFPLVLLAFAPSPRHLASLASLHRVTLPALPAFTASRLRAYT